MAIIKQKEMNSGFTCEYWKVLNVRLFVSVPECNCEVLLGCYKDRPARQAGKSVLLTEEYTFSVDPKKIKDFNDPIEQAYGEIKKLDFFKDGVDD